MSDELSLTDEEITGLAMITRPDNPDWLRDLVKNTETLVRAKVKQHYEQKIEKLFKGIERNFIRKSTGEISILKEGHSWQSFKDKHQRGKK